MKDDLKDRTFQFATRIVKLCRVLDDTPGVARTLAKQLLRSGTSIGATVEEGQGSQSKADFVSKYSIACKEARMSSNQSGEDEIRKAIIDADLVDCNVALPGQLLYIAQITECLWFLAKINAVEFENNACWFGSETELSLVA